MNNSPVYFDNPNSQALTIIAGMNVLESSELAQEIASECIRVCKKFEVNYIFKASFDKANRSSFDSFRGPGLNQGLQWLSDIKQKYNVAVISDIHEPSQAQIASQVLDILQIPAFLSRQTDLVESIAKTNKPILVKKAQFSSPTEMGHIIKKFAHFGNEQTIICERGTLFGYNNLVVDMQGFDVMKQFNKPLFFDVTHSLQQPGGLAKSTGGRRESIFGLARSAVAQKIAGIFIETHPNPNQAKCDGPCALPLKHFESLIKQLTQLDKLVKSFEDPITQ